MWQFERCKVNAITVAGPFLQGVVSELVTERHVHLNCEDDHGHVIPKLIEEQDTSGGLAGSCLSERMGHWLEKVVACIQGHFKKDEGRRRR